MVWIAAGTYLLVTVSFAVQFKRAHPRWHWAPVLFACLAWPYLAALKAWAFIKRDLLGR
jgi:uncharacterized membrane protein YbhN (UPF0104 family)